MDTLEQRRDFAFYASLDPRIGALLAEAQTVKPTPGQRFCANVAWYGPDGLRSRLRDVVGYGRQDGVQALRTTHAYSTVFQSSMLRCHPATMATIGAHDDDARERRCFNDCYSGQGRVDQISTAELLETRAKASEKFRRF